MNFLYSSFYPFTSIAMAFLGVISSGVWKPDVPVGHGEALGFQEYHNNQSNNKT